MYPFINKGIGQPIPFTDRFLKIFIRLKKFFSLDYFYMFFKDLSIVRLELNKFGVKAEVL